MSATRKRRRATLLGRYVLNPPVRLLFRLGVPMPGTAILETTGRKSGSARRTPVTNGLDGDSFWVVTEHGRHSSYVRNIEADPRVRVKTGRRWRSGTAEIVEEDPHECLAAIARLRSSARMNTRVVVAVGTELLVVRIALDS